MGNPVVHWELLSKDPAKVSAFYEKLFGWKIQHRPELNYRIVETGGEGGINGGIMRPEHEGEWPGNMTVYIAVDDLAAYRSRIVAAGGKILIEEQAVPGMGALSLFTDPDGRMMGLWKTKPTRKDISPWHTSTDSSSRYRSGSSRPIAAWRARPARCGANTARSCTSRALRTT